MSYGTIVSSIADLYVYPKYRISPLPFAWW